MARSYRKKKPKRTKRHKKQSKTNTVDESTKFTDIDRCVKLFKKYKLTSVKEMVRWVTHNHPDKLTSKGVVVSETLTDDYKDITGCFAKRKEIIDKLKKGTTTQRKKKKPSKPKPITLFSIF